jgi:hypothetical protein
MNLAHTRFVYFMGFITLCDRDFRRYLCRRGLFPTSIRMEDAALCEQLSHELRVTNPSDDQLLAWSHQEEQNRTELVADTRARDEARRRAEARYRRDAIPLKRVYLKRD